MARHLDQDCETFVVGRWEHELLSDVADADPDYLTRLLDTTIEADEREAIERSLQEAA